MPTTEIKVGKSLRRRVDLWEMNSLGFTLSANAPAVVCFEDVQGFGKQNAAAAFVFGRATCAAEMMFIAHDCPMHYVTPAKWKKDLGINSDKEMAVLEATRVFPAFRHLFQSMRGERTKAQAIGSAEAALLAHYALLHVILR